MFQQEFEWLTSNTRVAYPFVDRVNTPLGSSGDPFSDLIVDAYLTYKTAEEQDVRLYSLGDPADAFVDVEFWFADNTVAFTSAGAAFNKSVMGDWTLLEWSTEEGAARVLLDTAKITEFTWPALPTAAVLVGHALQPVQTFVNTLGAEGNSYAGTVELIAGFNVRLEVLADLVAAPSARNTTRVRVSVEAGAGLGTFPDCDFDTPPIFTINGTGPDEQGNFLLNPKDCYRGQIPITNPLGAPPWTFLPHSYKLFNDCSPCCECEDYVFVYDELLRRVHDQAKVMSDRFYQVRDDFQERVDQILLQTACREQPEVNLKLVARQGWCVAVQVIVHNNGACDSESILINIEMDGPTGQAIPDAARLDTDDEEHKPFALGGAWPNYTVEFTDGVRGARTLVASFELYFPIGQRSPGSPVTATATGTVSGVAVADSSTTRLTEVFNKF